MKKYSHAWIAFMAIKRLEVIATTTDEKVISGVSEKIRTEAKALGCVQKIGFGLASFLLGAGLAMALLPDYKVTTYYSNGSSSTRTESDPGNIIILAMKFALMAAGVLVYCFISLLIMTYATVSAQKRMYDWGKLAKQAAVAATAAATTVADTVAKKTSADKTETEA